jgi:hypothetical protein
MRTPTRRSIARGRFSRTFLKGAGHPLTPEAASGHRRSPNDADQSPVSRPDLLLVLGVPIPVALLIALFTHHF